MDSRPFVLLACGLGGLLALNCVRPLQPHSQRDGRRWLAGDHHVHSRYSVGVPVQSANGLPTFVQYRQGGAQPWAVVLVEVKSDRIDKLHYFLDTETLLAKFGMPAQLS